MNSRRCNCCLPSLNIVNQLLVTFSSESRLSCLVVIVRHWESLGSITDIQQQQQHGLVWGGTCRLWAIGRELRGYGLQSLVYGLTGLWHASNVRFIGHFICAPQHTFLYYRKRVYCASFEFVMLFTALTDVLCFCCFFCRFLTVSANKRKLEICASHR